MELEIVLLFFTISLLFFPGFNCSFLVALLLLKLNNYFSVTVVNVDQERMKLYFVY